MIKCRFRCYGNGIHPLPWQWIAYAPRDEGLLGQLYHCNILFIDALDILNWDIWIHVSGSKRSILTRFWQQRFTMGSVKKIIKNTVYHFFGLKNYGVFFGIYSQPSRSKLENVFYFKVSQYSFVYLAIFYFRFRHWIKSSIF